jgi:hypothetical protein
MHKTLIKVKNKKLADLIENIIKEMNKSEMSGAVVKVEGAYKTLKLKIKKI